MATVQDFEIPNFDEVLGGLLARVTDAHRPLLIAMLERVAAAKYREWGALPEFESDKEAILGCATREEEIADKIEALYPDALAIEQTITDALPELGQVADNLFGDRTVLHQMAVLSAGERSGGRVWADLAQAEQAENSRDAMASCISLENANADVLDGILRTH